MRARKDRAKTCPQTGKRWRPKHGRERVVPLRPEAVRIAREAFENSPGPWLFWSPTAIAQPGHYRHGVIWRALKKVMQLAGVKRGTIHTFRHLCCSFLADHNVQPLHALKILGWESLDLLLVYYHVNDSVLLRALDRVPFSQVLKPPERKNAG